MPASQYTDADRARVNTELTVTNGNVAATARITGIPKTTIIDWKKKWEREGVPALVEQATVDAVAQFVGDASRVRDLALTHLERAIPKAGADGKAKDLAVIVGVLDDKIARAQGKPTSINEQQNTGPSPRELQAAMSGYITGIREDTRQRELDIIEANTIDVQARSVQAHGLSAVPNKE